MNSIDKRNSVKKDYDLLNESNFDIIYETEKYEIGDNVIGKDGNDTIYIISRKKVDEHWSRLFKKCVDRVNKNEVI